MAVLLGGCVPKVTGGSRHPRGAPSQGALFIVLTGLAGSGKTELLAQLAARGEQTIDLEALANHRGSVFGGIGRAPQPGHGAFVASVEAAVARCPAGTFWIEDEGPFIGSVGLPLWLHEAMCAASTVEVVAPFAARVDRLFAEYGALPASDLIDALRRCAPRAGAGATASAIAAIQRGDARAAIERILPYYDRAYAARLALLPRPRLARYEWPSDLSALLRAAELPVA